MPASTSPDSPRAARPRAATTPSAPARPRGAARRLALLEAVLQIVAEQGADAVTHRRVAELAGLPLASTTYWFESKEHLLTAALELAAERDLARLGEHVERAPEGADPLALAITAIVSPTEPIRSSLITTYALLLEAARRPALREIARRWTDAYLDTLEVLLGRAGSPTARADAELLLAAADGLLIEQLASGRGENLETRLVALGRTLLERS